MSIRNYKSKKATSKIFSTKPQEYSPFRRITRPFIPLLIFPFTLQRLVKEKFHLMISLQVFPRIRAVRTQGPDRKKLDRWNARQQPIKFKDSGFQTRKMLKKKIKYDNHINMAPCVITVMLGVLGPSDSVVFLFLFTLNAVQIISTQK